MSSFDDFHFLEASQLDLLGKKAAASSGRLVLWGFRELGAIKGALCFPVGRPIVCD